MHLSKSLPIRIIAATIAVLSLSACSHTASKLAPAAVNQINPEFSAADYQKTVARVNGTPITAAELKRAEKILLSNKPGLKIGPNLKKDFEMQALNQLISAELLYQESRKLEIKDLDKQTENKVAETRSRFANEKDYVKGLGEIGMDEKSFLGSVRHDLSIAYLVNTTIANGVKVTEEEAKKFYDENRDKFTNPEQVRASHLLIGVDAKAGLEAKKAAREKAEKLHGELVKGADFAELARANSTCPSNKAGGDLGFFSKGKLDPAFEQAAFALKTGELSGVVETRFGYHLIKLVDRKKAETIPFSQARGRIGDYLKSLKTNQAVELFVGETRKSAKIEVLL